MEDNTQGSSEFKPGETIHPSTASAAPTAQSQVPQATAQPTVQPPLVAPAVIETVASAASPAIGPPQAAETSLPPTEQFAPLEEDPEAISWTASEFIDHDKSFDWYLGLAVVAILAAVVLYIFFRDIITSITPLVAALALGFYGRRRPRQLQYRLDSQGISIAEKFFPYEMFRSFAVMEDGPFASIAFLPLKRFGLLTTVYLDPEDEDRIIDLISQYLPLEPRDHDAVDRLMKRIRF